MMSPECVAIFWVVNASSGEKSGLQFSIPSGSGAGGEGGVSRSLKARWNTRGTLWSARERALVARSTEQETHTKCVSRCPKAERKPPRSSTSASQCGLRCRAPVYRHGEEDVDFKRRKILLFKNERKKNIFELGIGFLDISCHYLSLGGIFHRRKFSAYTVIWTDDLPT